MVGLSKRKQYTQAFLYLFPAVFMIGLWVIYPVYGSIRMSFFTEWNLFTQTGTGFGLDNYIKVWNDSQFQLALSNTLVYTFWVVPVSIAASLIIAVLLSNKMRGMKVFESIFFLPYITNIIAIGLAFRFIFHSRVGAITGVFNLLGLEPIGWLNDPEWALITLIIFGVWGGLAFKIVIFMAGLQNIDPQYYQAAKIDGAGRLKTFFRISLPLLAPIVAYISVISLIGSIKVYVEIVGIFGGGAGQAGPANSALSIVYYVYQKFYQESLPTIAAAASVMMFGFILIVTIVQLWINRRRLTV
jgi:ABC-type sugar transport systems, permease components